MPIVLAAPMSTNPDTSAYTGLPMSWEGWNGSFWSLSDVGTVPRMATGVEGLHQPQMQVFKSSSALVPGSSILGYSIDNRSVYWPLIFNARSTVEWRTAYSGFFDSVHPVKPGTWTVGLGQSARTLPITGVFGESYAFKFDPFIKGHALIGVELVATRPLWRGKPIVAAFGGPSGVGFIPPEGAPTFHISPAATFSTASINNPGNEPSYLRWELEGPLDLVQLGVGAAVIEVPFPIPAGSKLVIDTDPTERYATLNGVDCTRELGFQMFAPVPAGGSTPLVIIASGAGAVEVELTPLYWRAF